MTIGYLVHTFPKLSETFVLNQVSGLAERSLDVKVFPEKLGKVDNIHSEFGELDLRKNIIYRKHPAGRIKGILDTVYGFIIRPVNNLMFYKKVFKQLNSKRRVSRLKLWHDVTWNGVEYETCDLVCCHHGPQGLRGVDLKKAGVLDGPIVTFIHGYDITQYVKKHGEDCYDELFENADLLLPISKLWKARLIELGCPAHKIRVHRMGVDLSKFEFRERSVKEMKDPARLVSVARLTEKKGIRYAIEAVRVLRDRGYDVVYEIIGDGEERKWLEQLIVELQLQDRVHLAGKKYDEELLHALDEASIFVLPSVTTQKGDKEGLPVALMEAMALGIPVVSTWHSGIPELVRDGENGLLVEERDVDGLARAIEGLLSNPDQAIEMSRRGRKSVERQHDVEKLNGELVQIFSKLVDA